jgi:DNA-binding Xre family transcriptional regulator
MPPIAGYRWHLRLRMAERGMFATTDLVPLLAERGVVLSREQVYRLVTGTPERLSLRTLSALCDILGCGRPTWWSRPPKPRRRPGGRPPAPGRARHRRPARAGRSRPG